MNYAPWGWFVLNNFTGSVPPPPTNYFLDDNADIFDDDNGDRFISE